MYPRGPLQFSPATCSRDPVGLILPGNRCNYTLIFKIVTKDAEPNSFSIDRLGENIIRTCGDASEPILRWLLQPRTASDGK